MFKMNKSKQSADGKEPSLMDTIDISSVSKARKLVSALPITDMGETTRQLFVALNKLNDISVSPHVRTDITEALLSSVNTALENLDKHFLSRAYPLPSRSQKVFDLKKAMLMELAGSYQLAALDMLTKSVAPKKALLTSIGKAIHYMNLVIVNDYSIYTKNKKNIWNDIHHLYSLACDEGIDTKKMPGKEADSQLTIEEKYKLINLIALTSPNSLGQNEVKRVREFFTKIISDVSFIPSEEISGNTIHLVSLDRDEPASLIPKDELPAESSYRVFDLSKVTLAIDDFLDLSENSELGKHDKWPMLTYSLAKRLDHALTYMHNRKYKRFDREEKASVVIRMGDVIPLIRGNKPIDSMVDANREDQAENIYDALAAEDKTETPWTIGEEEEEERHGNIIIHRWKIENSSSDGYGIKQLTNESTTARVGELTGIKDPNDDANLWQIAVIRWIDSIRGSGLKIGLEILSIHSLVIKVNEVKSRKISHKLPLEGILLPTVEGVRDESNLIFPGFIFKVGDEMKITIGAKEEEIRITKIDTTVGNFVYCNFEILEGDDSEGIESFDDVWEFL